MPTLRLLVTILELPSLDRMNEAGCKPLKDLIIQKILLPCRASFFDSKNYSKAASSDDPLTSSTDLLAPLANFHHVKAGEEFEEAKTIKGLWPISILFQVAIQSLTRTTPKQRSVEDSWLQYLFYRILQQGFRIGAADALSKPSTQHLLSINQMLRDITDHNIRISVSKLEPLLTHIMSCLGGTPDVSAICETVNLCILIDANIFIGPGPIAKEAQGNNPRISNPRLATLLLWITNSAWKRSLEMDPIYEIKLLKIVSPLVEAYAKARSLLSFVSYWQEQLALCQNKVSDDPEFVIGTYLPRSLWEDERLIQLIARLAESTLTAGQINNLLLDTHARALTHETLGGSDDSPNLVASLITMDCASGITLDEAKSDRIKDIAKDVYHSSLDWLLNKTYWPVDHRWRVWRIIIALNKQWNFKENHSTIQGLEQQVISKAVELTTRARLRAPKDEDCQYIYAEEFYAFAFVVSSSSRQHEPSDQYRQLSHDLIETVIKWISGYAISEWMNDEKQDQMAPATDSKAIVQWNGQSDGVVSLDILHLCYLAQLLTFPEVFQLETPSFDVVALSLTLHRFLKVNHQHQIFQNIYRGAIAFRSSSQAELKPYRLLSTPINYLSLWNKLVKIESLQENRALTSSNPHSSQ